MTLEELSTWLNVKRPPKLPDALDEIERRIIITTLAKKGISQTDAARELGYSEQSFRYRLKVLGIKSARERGIDFGRPLQE